MSHSDAVTVASGWLPRPPSLPRSSEDRSVSTPDEESRAWLSALRGEGETRERAVSRLHELLLRAACFEVARRRATLNHLRGGDFDDITVEAADDALVAVLGKLDDYRGESRFSTWVDKFALLEAAVKLRRRAWQGREIPLEPESWALVSDERPSPHQDVEIRELLRSIRAGIEDRLTRHQREVFTALALNGVPIDVLAERLGTTRGALYKTLHDARTKLRARLAEAGGHGGATVSDKQTLRRRSGACSERRGPSSPARSASRHSTATSRRRPRAQARSAPSPA